MEKHLTKRVFYQHTESIATIQSFENKAVATVTVLWEKSTTAYSTSTTGPIKLGLTSWTHTQTATGNRSAQVCTCSCCCQGDHLVINFNRKIIQVQVGHQSSHQQESCLPTGKSPSATQQPSLQVGFTPPAQRQQKTTRLKLPAKTSCLIWASCLISITPQTWAPCFPN